MSMFVINEITVNFQKLSFFRPAYVVFSTVITRDQTFEFNFFPCFGKVVIRVVFQVVPFQVQLESVFVCTHNSMFPILLYSVSVLYAQEMRQFCVTHVINGHSLHSNWC